MDAWEKFGRWLMARLWPRWENDVSILEARLATCHKRMREMYWDEKAKEMEASRIAGLEDAVWRTCVALHICGQTEAARKFCEETGIQWNQEVAEKWRKPEPAGVSDSLTVVKEQDAPVPLMGMEVRVIQGDGSNFRKTPICAKCHTSVYVCECPEFVFQEPDPATVPDALNIKVGRGETIVLQTPDPESPILVYAGCSVCMKPKEECKCEAGFRP